MHIRFDTSGISQLLMNTEKIKEFKKQYEIEHPKDILNMNTKADMLSSFEKLLGRKPNNKEEGGMFATSIWKHVTNLETCKQYKELYSTFKNVEWFFDNSIVTDGTSVSFHIIDRKEFGRKAFYGKKKKETLDEVYEHNVVNNIVEEESTGDFKILSCDPGKRDILAFSDGIQTICYTRGQRQHDTFIKERHDVMIGKKRKVNLEEFETQVLNLYTKKSCFFDKFKMYSTTRKSKEKELLALYSKPLFRQFKYLGYVKTKSSESKFASRTFKTFKTSSLQSKHSCATPKMLENAIKEISTPKQFLIAWGNWGRQPNALKGCSPTPGIGIRRRFEGWFKTKTTDEYLTSQTCPCCRGERCLKKH